MGVAATSAVRFASVHHSAPAATLIFIRSSSRGAEIAVRSRLAESSARYVSSLENRFLMGPPIAHVPQFADETSFRMTKCLPEYRIPLLPHEAKQQGNVQMGFPVIGPIRLIGPAGRHLGDPILSVLIFSPR